MRPIPIYTVTLVRAAAAALVLIGAYRIAPLLAAGLAVLMFFILFAYAAFTLAGRADDAIDEWADHLSYGDSPAVPFELSGHAERNTRGRDTHTHGGSSNRPLG